MNNEAKLTASQARNLEIIKANGGTAEYGQEWPKGLNQGTLRRLAELGHLTRIMCYDSIAEIDTPRGYRLSDQG